MERKPNTKKKGSRETVSVPSSPSGIVLGLRNECVFHVTYWNTAECSWTLVLSFSSFSLSSSSYLHFFCPSSSLAFFLCLCFIFLILSRAIHIVRTLNICVKKESSGASEQTSCSTVLTGVFYKYWRCAEKKKINNLLLRSLLGSTIPYDSTRDNGLFCEEAAINRATRNWRTHFVCSVQCTRRFGNSELQIVLLH